MLSGIFDWLYPLNVMFSRFMHLIGCNNTSFFFMDKYYSATYKSHFIYPFNMMDV